jgi:hypothetical protein
VSQADNPPPPPTTTIEVHLPEPRLAKAERERQAFLRLLPGLMQTHRDLYVAIHDGQVVDSGPNRAELACRVMARVKAEIYVGLVSEQPDRVIRLGRARNVTRWEPQV